MSLAVAILVAIVVLLAALWARDTSGGKGMATDRGPTTVVVEAAPDVVGPDPAYDYGVSYTDAYDYVPAYSYGTTREYRMRHGRHMWAPRDIHSPAQHARNIGHLGVRRGNYVRTPGVPSPVPPMGRARPLPNSYATKTRLDKPRVVPIKPTPGGASNGPKLATMAKR